MIPVYSPYLTKKSLKYAHDALVSTWISSKGKYIDIVSDKLSELLNVKHVLLVNNGTSATHIVAKCMYYKYPNINSLIASNCTYIAALNSFLFDNKNLNIKVFDLEEDTWNIDINNIKDEDAIFLVVHNLGNIINVPKLKEKYKKLIFVEDNCEGLFGKYENKYSGTESEISSISFFGNKNITCGEGGAILTNDSDLFEYSKCIHGQGQSQTRFVHKYLGYNYRMTNVAAAILLGQLEHLPYILNKKRKIFNKYINAFKNVEEIKIQQKEENCDSANWMFGIRIPHSIEIYKTAESFFSNKKIEIRPMFYPFSKHEFIKNYNNIHILGEDVGVRINRECIILPSHPMLNKSEQDHIINTVFEFIKYVK